MEETKMTWARWINVTLGVWLILSPFILEFTTDQAIWNNIIVGFLVMVFSFVGKGVLTTRGTI